MRRLTAFAAAFLAVVPGSAGAAEPPCLTSGEFAALAGYALPSIISGTTQRCAATLGAESYLRRNGAQLSSRYAARKAADWPGAKAAFLKLSATGNADTTRLIGTMPDASLQQMLDAMMEGIVGQQIPLQRCTAIDTVVRLLAPLPPQNAAELIAVAAGLTAQTGKAKVGAIRLCPVAS